MTPAQMLKLFEAEFTKYGIAAGATYSVYRHASPLPGANTKPKYLFTSKSFDACEQWRGRKAMAAVKRAMT